MRTRARACANFHGIPVRPINPSVADTGGWWRRDRVPLPPGDRRPPAPRGVLRLRTARPSWRLLAEEQPLPRSDEQRRRRVRSSVEARVGDRARGTRRLAAHDASCTLRSWPRTTMTTSPRSTWSPCSAASPRTTSPSLPRAGAMGETGRNSRRAPRRPSRTASRTVAPARPAYVVSHTPSGCASLRARATRRPATGCARSPTTRRCRPVSADSHVRRCWPTCARGSSARWSCCARRWDCHTSLRATERRAWGAGARSPRSR